MDVRARDPDFDPTELMATWADSVLSRIRVAVPVKLSRDSDGHTVEVQPQVQGIALQPDGTVKMIDLPSFGDVPIHHAGGGGITMTHAHKEGDEGILLMTQASFDVWFKQGGVQSPGDVRLQTLSDGFYVPGIRNQTRALKGVSTNSTQVRSDDKQSLVDVAQAAVTTVRGTTAVQVNDKAAQVEKGGSQFALDRAGVQIRGGKLLWNC